MRGIASAGVASLAAAAVLAAPLSIGAQQQTPNPRSGWPCAARIDPSYFRIAEGSGGHLLLLAPDEIGESAALLTAFSAHPQTIFRLAGSVMPGLQELQVPIDSSVDSLLISISVQCLQVADVVRPSGPVVFPGDDVTDLSSFRAVRMVIVKNPEAGVWSIRLQGSGVAGVVVQARSTIGISQVEFAAASTTAFTAVPFTGVENTLRIRMSGPVSDLRASLVSGVFTPIANLPLAAGDTPGSYVSRLTPRPDSFRLLVAGKDAAGYVFQRMYAPLLTPAR